MQRTLSRLCGLEGVVRLLVRSQLRLGVEAAVARGVLAPVIRLLSASFPHRIVARVEGAALSHVHGLVETLQTMGPEDHVLHVVWGSVLLVDRRTAVPLHGGAVELVLVLIVHVLRMHARVVTFVSVVEPHAAVLGEGGRLVRAVHMLMLRVPSLVESLKVHQSPRLTLSSLGWLRG